MKKAGHDYCGQTEILEQYLAQPNQKAEMVFICDKFCLMLITRHVALKQVCEYIKKDSLVDRIEDLLRI